MVWDEIKKEYIADRAATYRGLAKKYDVSKTTLERKAKKEDWIGLRRQAQDKAETKLVNAVSDKKVKIDDKYYRIVDKLLDKAEAVVDTMPIWQPSSLKEMATALKYIKECKGVKSEADMREQEARIANLEKQNEKVDASASITVTFDAGPEEWNE